MKEAKQIFTEKVKGKLSIEKNKQESELFINPKIYQLKQSKIKSIKFNIIFSILLIIINYYHYYIANTLCN